MVNRDAGGQYMPRKLALESTVVKLSCFGFGSAKGKKGSRNNAMDQENSSRCHFDDSFSDMASCGAARDKRSGHDQKASPSQATSKQCQSLKPGGLPPRTVDIQNSEAKIAALLDNASMHDSGSSLKEALGLKARLQEGQQAQQTRIPDSIDTKPVQEEKDVEAPVLRPEWQINPLDIFFCSKRDNKLLKLGKGGFGTVYKGVWRGKTVAVKVCRQQHLTAQAMQQFQSEVAILNGCSHPNVVEFVGACCWKGGRRTVLVTEYMAKGDLCTALAQAPHLYAWNNLGRDIARDVACGLAFLHSRNVVHFDLKSANILLDKSNGAKLADVGLAKILTEFHGEDQLSTILATGELGTFAWAAPEVLLGFTCNCKADIFSFGVLMWELCSGDMPQGRCLRPLKVPEEASEEVAELIMNCLRHDPALRPSARAIVEALKSI